jgi:hypothetical protein
MGEPGGVVDGDMEEVIAQALESSLIGVVEVKRLL